MTGTPASSEAGRQEGREGEREGGKGWKEEGREGVKEGRRRSYEGHIMTSQLGHTGHENMNGGRMGGKKRVEEEEVGEGREGEEKNLFSLIS